MRMLHDELKKKLSGLAKTKNHSNLQKSNVSSANENKIASCKKRLSNLNISNVKEVLEQYKNPKSSKRNTSTNTDSGITNSSKQDIPNKAVSNSLELKDPNIKLQNNSTKEVKSDIMIEVKTDFSLDIQQKSLVKQKIYSNFKQSSIIEAVADSKVEQSKIQNAPNIQQGTISIQQNNNLK